MPCSTSSSTGVVPAAHVSAGFIVDSTGACAHVKDDVLRDEARAHRRALRRRAAAATDAKQRRWQRYDPSIRRGCSNCSALPTCMGGCPWEYERLGRVDHGECDPFRFFAGAGDVGARGWRSCRTGGSSQPNQRLARQGGARDVGAPARARTAAAPFAQG
ncbi:MAG: SPASM domain-containing protein [Gemmatimonadetes bacterium]|nr:SPASM domain-containing protein [Gemmatimonadota bacterium]